MKVIAGIPGFVPAITPKAALRGPIADGLGDRAARSIMPERSPRDASNNLERRFPDQARSATRAIDIS